MNSSWEAPQERQKRAVADSAPPRDPQYTVVSSAMCWANPIRPARGEDRVEALGGRRKIPGSSREGLGARERTRSPEQAERGRRSETAPCSAGHRQPRAEPARRGAGELATLVAEEAGSAERAEMEESGAA